MQWATYPPLPLAPVATGLWETNVLSQSFEFLAHLARASSVFLQHLKNKYSNIFFYKTTGPTVLKFHMEHDLTPGPQNYKIGSGRITKMAAVTKNSKNKKINFFSRTTGFRLNFGMKYQQNIDIQNCKNEKNL